MISFIVIGRNEGWRLQKCLQGIVDTITYNKLKDYEIIYVDSGSTDNTINVVQSTTFFCVGGLASQNRSFHVNAKKPLKGANMWSRSSVFLREEKSPLFLRLDHRRCSRRVLISAVSAINHPVRLRCRRIPPLLLSTKPVQDGW